MDLFGRAARRARREEQREERRRARRNARRRFTRRALMLAVLVLAVLVFARCAGPVSAPGPTSGSTPGAAPTSTSTPSRHAFAAPAPLTTGAAASEATKLDHIAIGALDQDAGRRFDRIAQFGRPWLDVDHNGCPTDEDMARRDLTGWTAKGRCAITGGRLLVSYDGVQNGQPDPLPRTPRVLQLDHVNALRHAYMSGAAGWDPSMRVAFANDPRNLILTNTHANESKQDQGPDTYVPNNPRAVCRYVYAFVDVTSSYPLTITPGEHDALAGWLSRCPDPNAVPQKVSP